MASTETPKKIKVLAIDDDEFMRIFLKDVFIVHSNKSMPYEFSSASCVKEGEAMIKSNKPDILLLDLSLPFEPGGKPVIDNGFKILQDVKADKDLKDVKILVFSGYSEKEIKEKIFELGASDYFVKGEYLPKDLIDAVNKHR